ncbi:MAG: Ig-like domain-containing protein [Candidatus Micrarchaeota archaeon]|nr:Ig-like domain-containing protein [Candidatus Micrarchaeota archaeon]
MGGLRASAALLVVFALFNIALMAPFASAYGFVQPKTVSTKNFVTVTPTPVPEPTTVPDSAVSTASSQPGQAVQTAPAGQKTVSTTSIPSVASTKPRQMTGLMVAKSAIVSGCAEGGDCIVSSDTTLGRTVNYRSFTIPSGVVVTVDGSLVINARDVTIDGSMIADGAGGGNGKDGEIFGGNGNAGIDGTSGGSVTINANGKVSIGGRVTSNGGNGGDGGDNDCLYSVCRASKGGNAGNGGTISVNAGDLVVTGTMLANGGYGGKGGFGDGCDGHGGNGGTGGSGGTISLKYATYSVRSAPQANANTSDKFANLGAEAFNTMSSILLSPLQTFAGGGGKGGGHDYTFPCSIDGGGSNGRDGANGATGAVNTIQKTLASITITPSAASVKAGDSVTFNAAGTDGEGKPFTINPSWSTADQDKGTITSSGTSATFTGKKTGSTTLTATQGSVSASASVTVVPGAPASITLSASSPTATAGQGVTITAVVKDFEGNTVADGTNILFSATDGSATPASVSTTGGSAATTLYSTVPGTATVTASANSVTQSVSVTFNAGPADAGSSTVSANVATIPANGVNESIIIITLKDAFGNPAAGRSVSLSSSRGAADVITPLVATTDANGVATFSVKSGTPGTSTIAATDSSDGVTVSQTAAVAFVDLVPPVLTFTAPTPNNQAITTNYTTITISSSKPLSTAILSWNGANENMAGSGTTWTVQKTSLANANYSFQAMGTDAAGNQGSTEKRWVVINYAQPDTVPPVSNSPPDAQYEIGSTATIPWVLYDDRGPGTYSVTKNGLAYIPATPWTNASNLAVPVDTSTTGAWNYAISFTDSSGNAGAGDTVTITVSDTTPPAYRAVTANSSDHNLPATFSAYWTDNAALSGFIFSTNNSGAWLNDSWTPFSNAWSNATKTLANQNNAAIGWRIYANDSSNNWNDTGTQVIVTTNTPPAVTAPSLDNANPLPFDVVTCIAGAYSDANSDPLAQAYWKWFKNGADAGAAAQALNLSSIAAVPGDIVTCAEIVSDGFDNSTQANSTNTATVASPADSQAPQWSNNKTTPASPVAYSPAQTLQLNVTWTDDSVVTQALLEWNGAVNYSMGKAGSEYYHSLPPLAAGTYSWRSLARDAVGNWNATPAWPYVVNQVTSSCSLSFNPPSPAVYGTAVNASCSCTNPEATAALYRNGADVTAAENKQFTVLGAGIHSYECNSTASQNYTSASATASFTVTQMATSMRLYFNGSEANAVVVKGVNSTVNVTAALNATPPFALFLNGSQINSGASPLANVSDWGVGYWNFTTAFAGNANYLPASKTLFLTVINPPDAVPPAVALNAPSDNSWSAVKSIQFNYTPADNVALSACTLWNNESVWGAKAGNSTPLANGSINSIQFAFASDGVYKWSVQCSDNSSNSAFAPANWTIKIDSTPPASNSPPDAQYGIGSVASISWTLTDNVGPGLYRVLKNGTAVGGWSAWANNTAVTIPVETSALGAWNYTIYYNDSLGSFGAPDTVIVTIGDSQPPIYSAVGSNGTDGAGEAVTVWAYWTDNVALSAYVFSTNNSGAWANQTGWMFYANDSSGNLNATPIQAIATVDKVPPTITFVSPTPANGAVLDADAVMMNATLSKNGGALLEWTCSNGTAANLSMLGGGTNYYKNMTGLKNGTHYYRVWANNSNGYWNTSETRNLTVPPFVRVGSFPEGRAMKLKVFNNYMYFGTGYNAAVYRTSDGVNWTLAADLSSVRFVEAMEVFKNQLYITTGGPNAGDGKIYTTSDGVLWFMVLNSTQVHITSLAVWNYTEFCGGETLYAGTYLNAGSGHAYFTCDGWTWYDDGDQFSGVWSIHQFGTRMYFGLGDGWITNRSFENTSAWSAFNLGDTNVLSMEVFNNQIYAGTANKHVWNSSTGAAYNMSLDVSPETQVNALSNSSIDSRIYAASLGPSSTTIWSSSNGADWQAVYTPPGMKMTAGFADFNGTGENRLYAAISGPNYSIVNGGTAYVYKSTYP